MESGRKVSRPRKLGRHAIAEALGLDLDVPADKAKVKAALKMYLTAGTLVVVKRMDRSNVSPKSSSRCGWR